ncbi:DUF983 domain-containing protein [uncultured Lacinutrix sp.]|uniref:DUF983 domain-containing protein n=1 Tax=uncultured Lacinutrix sp. TaxID=574032 RepID=UPI00260CA344|nr:DUF983 domain-containing protein [uncultured Lacinutrix sp.]
MFKKGSKLYSIITGTCPRCHEESMYVNKNPYALTELFKMHEHCSNCNTKYKIEPSFFFGAMYVSYGVGIALALGPFLISYFVFNSSINIAILAVIVSQVLLYPIIIRLSRNIWINLFMSYDKSKTKS